MQLRHQFALATLPSEFLFAALSQADLLQNTDQKLIHVVLKPTGRFDELALARRGQLLSLFNNDGNFKLIETALQNTDKVETP